MSEQISFILGVIAVLVVVTNIIVQTLKQVVGLHPNWLALIVSLALTLAAGGGYASVQHIQISWYMVVGAIVVGFMVAYAAMFGFDKLKQALEGIK